MDTWRPRQRYETGQGAVAWDCFGEGPPVVLLHGTPFSSFVWRDLAPALAVDHQVYVWDMLGYGMSDQRSDQDVSLRAQAVLFAELVAAWGIHRPAVVAHDFGGAVATRAHLLHGVDFERLALVDAVAHRPWGTGLFQLARGNEHVLAQLPPPVHEAAVRAYVESASRRGLAEATVSAYAEPWLGRTGQAALYRQMAQGDEGYTDEVQDRYRELTMPVLVCWGTDDTWLPPSKGEQLASSIPGAHLCWLEGAGHLVQEDAPAQLTAALMRFLGHGALPEAR